MQNKHQKNAYPTKKIQKTHGSVRAVQGCFWSPVENREGPIKSVLSDTDYLRNRSEDFSETQHEVRGKKSKKRSTDAFLRFRPVFSKTTNLCEKSHFWQFWDFAENPFRGFSLNLAKTCQHNSSKRWDSRFAWKIRYS